MRQCVLILILLFAISQSTSISASNNRRIVSEIILETTYNINFNVNISSEWKSKSVASRLNNPGNLRYTNSKYFRRFKTLEDGYNALLEDIEFKQTGRSRYVDSLTSLNDFIHVYAPPIENNTQKYVRIVCDDLGIDKFTPIKDIAKTDLARVIIRVEDHVLYEQMFIKKIEIKEVYRYE